MQIVIAAVGSPRGPGMREAIGEYTRRAERYFRLRVIEVPAARGHDRDRDPALEREGAALLRAIPDELERIALTREGDEMR